MKITHFLIWFLLVVILLPFLWLSVYNHPSSDDFLITLTSRDWGVYTSVVGYYKCWSSRFTSIFLVSINPLVFGSLWGYKLYTGILITVFTLAFHFFYQSVFELKRNAEVWMLSLWSVLVYMSAAPSLAEGFYYLGGSLFYQPGNILLLVLAALLCRYPPTASLFPINRNQLLLLFLQGGIVFLLGGCNEMLMFFSLAMLGAISLISMLSEKQFQAGWAFLILASIVSTAIVLLAPATYYRMEASGSFVRSWSEVMSNSAAGLGGAISAWFRIPAFVLLMIVLWRQKPGRLIPVLPITYRFLVSGFSLLLFFACFVPSFLGEGILQDRTANALQFTFLILLIFNSVLWKTAGNAADTASGTSSGVFQLTHFILVGVTLTALSPNYGLALRDLYSNEAKLYSHQRDDRIHRMESTKGDSVWVPPVTYKPKSIYIGDIGDFPKPWYDNNFAALYGKKFVHLTDSIHTGMNR